MIESQVSSSWIVYIDVQGYAAVVVEGFAVDDTVLVISKEYGVGEVIGYFVTPQLSTSK